MKKIQLISRSIFLALCFVYPCLAQDKPPRTDKFYTMSGAGTSFPIGETNDYMRPKFSTTLGVNLGVGNNGLFIYPKVSLHVFGYDELTPDEGYEYALKKGRSTTYLLNLALGYRKMVGDLSFYGFIGTGGGFILTPRALVDPTNHTSTLNNRTNTMIIFEPGAGIEYNLGGANLFIESSYMHGFGKIQNRSFNSIPITFGIKPNLSRVLR